MQALWLYRRFLSLYWINQFAIDGADALPQFNQTPIHTSEIKTFLDNELQLFYSCQSFSINDFEDYRAQATFSATYMLWITRVTTLVIHLLVYPITFSVYFNIDVRVHCSLQHFSQYPEIELIMKLRQKEIQEVLKKYCPERSSLWNFLRTP